METVVLRGYSPKDLKPCPCCGSKDVKYNVSDYEVFSNAVGYFVEIKCEQCGLKTPREIQMIYRDSVNGSIYLQKDVVVELTKLWNTRGGVEDGSD